MRGATILLGLWSVVLLGGLAISESAHAQPDSVRAAILEERGYAPDHSPRGALWRALAVPGWGQYYNRQYLKIPFVYGGLAGGTFAVYEMNRRYDLYRHAHLFEIGRQRTQDTGEENPYQHYEDASNRVQNRLGELRPKQLRELRDKYRRWRDLSIVGTGLFYALTVLDAYVSAHLLTFNVGEDLNLSVRPVGVKRGTRATSFSQPPPGEAGPLNPGLRLRLFFK